jgi:hypothetical protein
MKTSSSPERIAGCVPNNLDDNRNARRMQADGTFTWEKSGEPAVDSQAHFLSQSRG